MEFSQETVEPAATVVESPTPVQNQLPVKEAMVVENLTEKKLACLSVVV